MGWHWRELSGYKGYGYAQIGGEVLSSAYGRAIFVSLLSLQGEKIKFI